MQKNTVNVNAPCSLSPDELETLLRAEIELTGRGMKYGLQYFAEMRDRNAAARQMLAELLCGEVA